MVGANMAFYLTSLKLLLVPRDSKSRLLAALSCPKFVPIHLTLSRPFTATRYKKLGWSLRSAADDNRLNSSSSSSSSNESSGGTRLIRTIQVFQFKLTARLRELTKNLPVKLFSFLVGFYCATAFATVIGQTGDWDVLSAALTVAVVEGIGALMYKASLPLVDNIKKVLGLPNEQLVCKWI
ncbi:uncharacterized protein LOC131004410 isoform X2 [Salvia miltiorrhiza]|uniref:uncharacterized protein LOC131004410 isoform X2 n=1 Tax=Salvia miltiorrhiza TaxID=226208 RepID=UPI0025ABB962|nr:uncharacterized protein LOC131004410 isoform X2 [Salvia miltiorrhiza]XP_057787074.1 uncharacterized protein LOC131004410 isoform X2 [Salvia miltiorrhiza]XP_057787075.1 uncharacterized protein LOC131004410 isoform X2 [Salvia miltiorrhiza]